jgi:NitT/TauT family transport system substrate-binding protein
MTEPISPRIVRRMLTRPLILGVAVLLAAAGCSGGAASPSAAATPAGSAASTPATSAAASSASSPAASTAASVAPSRKAGPPEGQADAITIGVTSIGTSTLPILAAADELRAAGYKVETPEIAESELVVQGVAQGQFQFGAAANNAVMAAMEKGAPIKFLVDRSLNEWMVYAINDIKDCSGLAGHKIAIHSPGSVSGAMLKDWMKNTCPEVKFDPLIIEGSQNRLAAMLAGQIDATPMELADTIKLDQERPGEFHLLANFSEDLPDLHLTSVYTNDPWAKQNPDVVYDVVKAVVIQHRKIMEEDGYLLSLIKKYLPEEAKDEALAKTVADAYIDREFFPLNGGLTKEAVEYTLKFFGPDGTASTSKLLTFEETTDLSYLEKVLDELGRR